MFIGLSFQDLEDLAEMEQPYSKAIAHAADNARILKEYMETQDQEAANAFWVHIDLDVIVKMNTRIDDMIAAIEDEMAGL